MKLAMFGDLHYPMTVINRPDVLEARDAFFEHFLTAFLETEADYHISLGDLTNTGEIAEFEYIFQKVRGYGDRLRFLHVLGNHDTYTHPKAKLLSLTGQRRYGLWEEEEALVVVLDTARETRQDWSGFIDAEQLEWLESVMRKPSDKPLLVFAHHPLYGSTARSTEAMMSLDPSLDIRGVLGRWAGTGLYFNGHNHENSVVRVGQWHFIQTAAPLDIPAFRIVTVEGGEVRVELHRLESEALTKWARTVGENMPYYEPYPSAEGNGTSEKLAVPAAR